MTDRTKTHATHESTNRRTPVHIRWMIRRDFPEVLAIENASFGFPWSEDDFLKVLRQRNCIGMVAENADSYVLGFYVYALYKGYIRLLNFAVHPEHRRSEVGSQLIDKLTDKLSQHHRTRLVVNVRETNTDAQFFLRSQGFRATRVIREHYDGDGDTGEDAYEFVFRLPHTAPVESEPRVQW